MPRRSSIARESERSAPALVCIRLSQAARRLSSGPYSTGTYSPPRQTYQTQLCFVRSPLSSKSTGPRTVSNSCPCSAAMTACRLQRTCLRDRLRPDLDGGVAEQRVARGLEVLGTELLNDRGRFGVSPRVRREGEEGSLGRGAGDQGKFLGRQGIARDELNRVAAVACTREQSAQPRHDTRPHTTRRCRRPATQRSRPNSRPYRGCRRRRPLRSRPACSAAFWSRRRDPSHRSMSS